VQSPENQATQGGTDSQAQEAGGSQDSQAQEAGGSQDSQAQGAAGGTQDPEAKGGHPGQNDELTAALKKCESMTGSQRDECVTKAKKDHGEM
jgi:hypothetical protein